MVTHTRVVWTAVATFAVCLLASSVSVAQVSKSGYTLPLNLALEAASEAVQSCAADGYDVTATVVDVSGTPKVVLRGDHSTIQAGNLSFRKAYTIVAMGPVFHIDVTSTFVELASKFPNGQGEQLATAPNLVALRGGAAFKAGDEIVGGLGIDGSPRGDVDEACAKAGVAKVRDRLPH
jgi:uncharacterized protein GlcG (DUF336 family)